MDTHFKNMNFEHLPRVGVSILDIYAVAVVFLCILQSEQFVIHGMVSMELIAYHDVCNFGPQ